MSPPALVLCPVVQFFNDPNGWCPRLAPAMWHWWARGMADMGPSVCHRALPEWLAAVPEAKHLLIIFIPMNRADTVGLQGCPSWTLLSSAHQEKGLFLLSGIIISKLSIMHPDSKSFEEVPHICTFCH